MKEPKIYIETSVEKELPKESGEYFVFYKETKSTDYYNGFKGFLSTPTYFLREFSLPELMEELIESVYCYPVDKKVTQKTVNEFLTQKGIL